MADTLCTEDTLCCRHCFCMFQCVHTGHKNVALTRENSTKAHIAQTLLPPHSSLRNVVARARVQHIICPVTVEVVRTRGTHFCISWPEAVASLLRCCCGEAVCWRRVISLLAQSVVVGEVG